MKAGKGGAWRWQRRLSPASEHVLKLLEPRLAKTGSFSPARLELPSTELMTLALGPEMSVPQWVKGGHTERRPEEP